MNYLLIAAAVAIAILTAIVSFQYSEITTLHEDVATERANVVTLKTTIKDQNETILVIEKQRAADQVKLNWVAEKNQQAFKDQKDAEAKLESYRKRLDKVAVAKPELVSRLASRATGRVMRSFFQASGGREPEPAPSSVSPSPTVTDTPDASGSDRNHP